MLPALNTTGSRFTRVHPRRLRNRPRRKDRPCPFYTPLYGSRRLPLGPRNPMLAGCEIPQMNVVERKSRRRHQLHVVAVRSLVGSFGVTGIPRNVGRDAANSACCRLTSRGSRPPRRRPFERHVNPHAVHQRLEHVLRQPALPESLIPRVHSIFERHQSRNFSLRFHDAIANRERYLLAVRLLRIAHVVETREPAARNPPGAARIRALPALHPPRV